MFELLEAGKIVYNTRLAVVAMVRWPDKEESMCSYLVDQHEEHHEWFPNIELQVVR